MDGTMRSCNVYFWYGVYDSEETKDILFIDDDCKIIKKIIERINFIRLIICTDNNKKLVLYCTRYFTTTLY